jgi:neocarzinostatin family protein
MFADAGVMRRRLLMGGTMRRTFAFALVVALTVLGDAAIVGMSSAGAASHAKAHHSVEAKKKKKKKVTKPTIKVKPTSNLSDGQQVTVAGAGYKPNLTLGINECADKGDQTQAGDCDLAATIVVKSDAKGVVKPTKFAAKKGPFGGNNIVCTDTATVPNGCLINLGELSADPNAQQSSVAIKFSG